MTGYNGWSNYETWRVNLELFDGYVLSDIMDARYAEGFNNPHDLISAVADELERVGDDLLADAVSNTFVRGLVSEFINKVNFYEIAECIVDAADLPEHLTISAE